MSKPVADTNRPNGSQVFHRVQSTMALLLLIPLALTLSLVAYGSLPVRASGVAGTLGLLYWLVTLPRQNTLTITADSVSWRRRGRVCMVHLADVAQVVARKVVVNPGRVTATTYLLLAFEMRSGAEILSQALYGSPGSGNARMVDDAAAAISGRLANLPRTKSVVDEARCLGKDRSDPTTEPSESGRRVFTTSRKYLLPLAVIPAVGVFMWGAIVISVGLSGISLFYGGLIALSIFVIYKLLGSMKVIVDDESIQLIGIGQRREVKLSALREVRQVSDVQGLYEVTTLELVYKDGRVESCKTLLGSMWPEKPGWEMVHNAAALINARIGSV